MKAVASCPRCGLPLNAPDMGSSAWTCDAHGAVDPVEAPSQPTSQLLHYIAKRSKVPVWLPWPLPQGWLVTGVLSAGDERTGSRATAVACTGPAPLGGAGELLLISEEPGVGLGARFAGLDSPDPGEALVKASASAKLHAGGHPTSLWSVGNQPDRAAYVGEAFGRWLWVVLWPANAGYLMADDVRLMDLREEGEGFDVPCGALTPRLVA